MIIACGIDVEERKRFAKHLKNGDVSSLIEKVFTPQEIENNMKYGKHICFPLGFSCKEAFFKAFGKSWTNSPLGWQDIELLFYHDVEKEHRFHVKLNNHAAELFTNMKIKKISPELSYEDEFVRFQVSFEN